MLKIVSFSSTVGFLLILSLTFSLLPAEKVEIIVPNEEVEVIYNVYTDRVELTSNFVVEVNVSIYRIDTEEDALEEVLFGHTFLQSTEIDFEDHGLFLFVIVSPELIELTFSDSGVPLGLIVMGALLIIVRLAIWLYQSNLILLTPFNQY